ncbi:MAG: creatininase family protein [Oscillospiraceae bacterium]
MTTYWENLISTDIAALDKEKSLVLFPISAIEQHGPHLPVGTDTIILRALLERFVEQKSFEGWNVLVGPQFCIGKSNEHMDFAGTLTFTATTLYTMLKEICSCMAKHGFKKIILTNSHGGNTDLLNLISRDLRIDFGLEVYVFDWWFTPFWQDILATEKQSASPYGVFHACELETSLVMEIAPALVNTAAIADETPDAQFAGQKQLSLFGPITLGWKTKDVTESGVIGSPSYATPEKGKKFMQYAVDKLAAIVDEVIHFDY